MKRKICWILVGAASLGIAVGCGDDDSSSSRDSGGAAGAETGGTTAGGASTGGTSSAGLGVDAGTAGVSVPGGGGGSEGGEGGGIAEGGSPAGGTTPAAGTSGMGTGSSAGGPSAGAAGTLIGGAGAGGALGSAGEPSAGAAGVLVGGAGGMEAGGMAGAGDGPGDEMPLISLGSSWRFLDDGSDQGTDWYAPSFDDSTWNEGLAELGYGDGDEVTVVSYGPSSSAKYITTYFRHAFVVNAPGELTSLELRIRRDDGAIVYLNGVEIARTNMPEGDVFYDTVATAAVSGTEEAALHDFLVSPAYLVAGANVMAVEIHQNYGGSSDLSFDLELGLP